MASVECVFKYEALDELHQEIRLLRILPPRNISDTGTDIIECELFHTSLVTRGDPAYRALSYTWGDPSDGLRQIMLNGFQFLVGVNLNDALRRFRKYSESVILWADAICINQSDLDERNVQVARMHQIYSMADTVLVWLGPGDQDSKAAVEFMHSTVSQMGSTELSETFKLDDLWGKLESVVKFFTKPYWERMWVVQEYFLSKCTLVYCGAEVITSTTLKQFQEQWLLKNPVLVRRTMPLLNSGENYASLAALTLSGPAALHQFEDALGRSPSEFEVVNSLRRRKSSEPRDMIFVGVALLSGTRQKQFPINYKQPIAEVFADFTTNCIQETGRLDCWAALSGKQSTLQDLPSWAIDWTVRAPEHAYLDNIMYTGLRPSLRENCKAATETTAEVVFRQPGMLVCKGVRLDCVDKVCAQSDLAFNSTDPELLRSFSEWCNFVKRSEVDSIDIYVDMARTLLIDVKQNFSMPQMDADTFYTSFLGAMANKVDEHGLAGDIKLPEMIENYKDVKLSLEGQMYDFVNMAVPYLLKYIMHDRRLFRSTNFAAVGVGSPDVQPGDVLTLPLGCNFVMILRAQGDGTYRVVGPCYLNGFMQGEALQMREEGVLELECFTLR